MNAYGPAPGRAHAALPAPMSNGYGYGNPEYYGTGKGATPTRTYFRRHRWWYAWVPLFTAFIWLGTITSLLVVWLASGRPHYVSMSPGQKIAYISDVAADFLKPLFVAATCVVSVGFVLSLVIERWARNRGR